MATYPGRFNNQAETFLLGGINSVASILNIKDGEAKDIVNWDVELGGAIQPRSGYATKASLGTPMQYFSSYYRTDGSQVFVAVANGIFYEATSPSGPWTSRMGSVTLAADTLATGNLYIGTNIQNAFLLANGVNKPVISYLGNDLVTLESASRLTPPAMSITNVGTAGATTYLYKLTVKTGRGESLPTTTVATLTGNAALSVTNYNYLSWAPVLGDNAGYVIYKYDVPSGFFLEIGVAAAGSSSFTDTGQAFVVPNVQPPIVNNAYNTPNDWNINGYPQGFAVLARGKNQRVLAWRNDTVWASALNNPLDWFAVDDAFQFIVTGGNDSHIRAIGNLMDFTVIFTSTNGFFYTGSSPTDFSLSKIQGTGCSSPYSLVTVGSDLYLWGNRGPTTLKRILYGADIDAQLLTDKIRNILYSQTNQTAWKMVSGYHDYLNQKIIWAVPAIGQTDNTMCFTYKYLLQAWTKYDTWTIRGSAVLPDFTIYAAFTDGNINQVQTGNLDGVSVITATYTSATYDLDSALKKRILWNDTFMDATTGAYTVGQTITWDYGSSTMTSSHVLTQVSTDGRPIETLGAYANQHRVYSEGIGRAYQFTITHAANEPRPKVLGYRPEVRARGVR